MDEFPRTICKLKELVESRNSLNSQIMRLEIKKHLIMKYGMYYKCPKHKTK